MSVRACGFESRSRHSSLPKSQQRAGDQGCHIPDKGDGKHGTITLVFLSHVTKGMVSQMSTIIETVDSELIGHLQQAIGKIETERREINSSLDQRASLIQKTLEGLRANGNGSSSKSNGTEATPKSLKLSVSPERLGKVLDYLDKHPRTRQTDLVKKLGLNSGTVSVALRVLEQEGTVSKAEHREGSSNEWIKEDSPPAAKKRGSKKVAA